MITRPRSRYLVAFATAMALGIPLAAPGIGTAATDAGPQVTDLSPVSGSTVQGASVLVGGTLRFAAGDPATRLTMTVDNGPIVLVPVPTPVASADAEPFRALLNTLRYADGPHQLRFTAVDAQGETGTGFALVTFQNGLTAAPQITGLSPASGSTVQGASVVMGGTLRFTVGDPVTRLTMTVDNGPAFFVPVPIPAASADAQVFRVPLNTLRYADGPHQLRFTAVDGQGHAGSGFALVTFRNGLTAAPQVTGLSPASGSTVQGASVVVGGTLKFTVGDPVTRLTMTVDNGPAVFVPVPVPAASADAQVFRVPLNTLRYADGPHQLRFTAVDGQGHAGSGFALVTFRNGLTAAPQVVGLSPAPGTVVQGPSITVGGIVRFTVDDPVQQLTMTVDNGSPITVPVPAPAASADAQVFRAPLSLTGMATGTHTIRVTAVDVQGHTGAGFTTFAIPD